MSVMVLMSESSQNGRPVIFWISMRPGAPGPGDGPLDVPPSGPGRPCSPPVSTRPAASSRPRPGVFIPCSVLRVLMLLAGSGVFGLLITLEWPQVATVLATIGAIIGTGFPILDILRPRDDKAGSEGDRP